MKLTIQEIAEVAHEVNRALCQAFGDDSQLPWLETTLENKDASITQVEFTLANPDATPEDQHNEWMRNKLAKVKIDLKLLADLRARRGVYSAAQQAQMQEVLGGMNMVWAPLTEVKCRAASAWIREILLPAGEQPWGVAPTPIADLPLPIKKGIVEIADLVVINKADIDKQATAVVRAQWRNALHMLRPASPNWSPPVIALSALHKEGIVDFWEQVEKYQAALKPTGEFDAKRQHQALSWMWQLIDSGLRQHFRHHPRVQENLPAFTRSVEEGHTTPAAAAYALLDYLKH